MAKLRHVAIQVPDLEEAGRFYETVFDMELVCRGDTPFGNALMLSDGVMNLTLLQFPEGTKGMINGPDWAGMHHVGFVVDDAEATAQKIKDAGGSYYYTLEGDYEGLQRVVVQGHQRRRLRHLRARLGHRAGRQAPQGEGGAGGQGGRPRRIAGPVRRRGFGGLARARDGRGT